MANTITVIPGNNIGSTIGNIFLLVLVIVISYAVIAWIAGTIGVSKYVPLAPAV